MRVQIIRTVKCAVAVFASFIVASPLWAGEDVIDLTDLATGEGFEIVGRSDSDNTGASIDIIGDINNDGLDDIAIGAAYDGLEGRAYVIYGSANAPFGASIRIQDVITDTTGQLGFAVVGDENTERLGILVAGVGDLNNDGIDDFAIGASESGGTNRDIGEANIIFGREKPFPNPLELSGLDGADGFRVFGEDTFNLLGLAMDGIGDVNADGIDDLFVATARQLANETYEVGYVFYGSSSPFPETLSRADLDGVNGFVISATFDEVGVPGFIGGATGLGDFNSDGVDDFVIGTPGRRNVSGAGAAIVVFGRRQGFPAQLALGAIQGATGFRIDGETENRRFGASVASAGDFNADGISDVIISAPGDGFPGTFIGDAYIVFGSSTGFPNVLPISQLLASEGLKILGDPAYDSNGSSLGVGTLGDFNLDGVDDVLVGTKRQRWRSYVLFGQRAVSAVALNLSSLTPDRGLVLDGGVFSGMGSSVSPSSGDLNGDRAPDLVLGAPALRTSSGFVGGGYVFYGTPKPDEMFYSGFESI